jgi:hypothetical protein
LGVCAFGYAMAETGLLPARISAFGIEFSGTDQVSLLQLLAGVVFYFLCAFVVYATSDLTLWRINVYLSLKRFIHDELKERRNKKALPKAVREKMHEFKWYHFWLRASIPVSVVRAIFEFIVPIIIGVYVIIVLVSAKPAR